MIPELRQAFNANFTEAKYQSLLQQLDAGSGTRVEFRNSETPCFFPKALVERLAREGGELIGQLLGNADYLRAAEQAVPAAFRVPNEDAKPLFVQVDFGLDENLDPKLVEIQGFPSLYAYQPFLAETYRNSYGLDPNLRYLLGGLDAAGYRELLGRAIVGDHATENVILLEIEPQQQKTVCDFRLTEKLLGIQTVCLTQVRKEGRRLFYPRDGKWVAIERIYNRVIVDELVRKGIKPSFDFRDELDVQWAGHPNWYFKLSKFSLPFLRHPAVPWTQFLDQIDELPADLENYVLKPLYSFAGIGVCIGPTREDIAAVIDPSQAILQRRINFRPVIETPFGPTKTEIRMMYVWLDQLRAVGVLLRMGRGKMMGVDHNKDMRWVGASAAFWPA